jgi:hypothetical protein
MWRDGKIAKILNIYQEKLKITKTTFHSIRASHITHLLLIGKSVASVMNSVGHSQLSTTMRYLREIEKEKSIDGMTDGLVRKNITADVIPIKRIITELDFILGQFLFEYPSLYKYRKELADWETVGLVQCIEPSMWIHPIFQQDFLGLSSFLCVGRE